MLIFQQGWGLLMTALQRFTNAGVSPSICAVLLDALPPLLPANPSVWVTFRRGLAREAPPEERDEVADEVLCGRRVGGIVS